MSQSSVLTKRYTATIPIASSWANTGATTPTAISYTTLGVVGNTMYLFGGYNNTGPYTSAILSAPVANPTAWSNTGATLPAINANAHFMHIGSTVYLLGGYTGSGASATNTIYSAPATNPTSWTNTGATLAVAVRGGQLLVAGNSIYILGGLTAGGTATNVIQSANIASPTVWTNTGATLPAANWQSHMFVTGDSAYILGGSTGDGSTPTNTIFSARLSAPTVWTNTGATIPQAKQSGGNNIAMIGDRVYIFGGETTAATVTNTIDSAALSSPTVWTNTGTTINAGLGRMMIAVANNQIQLIGGFNGSVYTNTIFAATNSFTINIANGAYGSYAELGVTKSGSPAVLTAQQKTVMPPWHTDYAKPY